jgi:hypothetical protein
MTSLLLCACALDAIPADAKPTVDNIAAESIGKRPTARLFQFRFIV